MTQANNETIEPNCILYGYGYDAYIYTNNQLELQEKLKKLGVKIAVPLTKTDYNNREFVNEVVNLAREKYKDRYKKIPIYML